MDLRHATELKERVLDAVGECFKGLAVIEQDRFIVAASQHAVKQRVIEPGVVDGDAERIAERKVACGELPRMVNLLDDDVFGWPILAPPAVDSSLKSTTS